MGFHQHNAGSWSAAAEETMREFARHPKCVTIGKCGLAFFAWEFDKNKHRQNIMWPGEGRDSAAIAVAARAVAATCLNGSQSCGPPTAAHTRRQTYLLCPLSCPSALVDPMWVGFLAAKLAADAVLR